MKTYIVTINMQFDGDEKDIDDLKLLVSEMTNGDVKKSQITVNEMDWLHDSTGKPLFLAPKAEIERMILIRNQAEVDANKKKMEELLK